MASPDTTPTSSAGPVPTSSARPLAPAAPPPPTSADLITKAVQSGTLDAATGYLYRFYAQWGDERLPPEYRGEWSEDAVAGYLAEQDLSGFTAEQQALLRPFLVRPTHPDSYWTELARQGPVAGATGRIVLAVSSPCDNTGGYPFARVDLPSIPVTIWGQCHFIGGTFQFDMVDQVDEARQFMTDLWGPMTKLMGKPIGDKYATGTRGPGEVPESNDGRLDIYVVDAPQNYQRDLNNSALAENKAAAPYDDQGRSSSYIVYDPSKGTLASVRKALLAHEFFHSLQSAHNSVWNVDCPYAALGDPCPNVAKTYHWFLEASATWAEFYFVPESRPQRAYPWWRAFLTAGLPLPDDAGTNQYQSSQWPIFMQQESPRGAQIIADAWTAMEGKKGWAANQAALDGVMPFASHFRDFAVRVWNERLDPGDPISPRFQALDSGFPTVQPGHTSPAPRFREPQVILNPFFQRTYTFTEDVPELWASYYDLNIDSSTKRLTFDFAGLQPNGQLDVDALVRVRDIGWQRRELDPLVTEWCLDKAADAIEQVILVLSNHELQPKKHVKGDWTVQPDPGGCATASDALVYTATRTVGTPGVDYYSKAHESLTLHLNLKANDGTSDYFADFLNNGSTYTASVQTEMFIQGVDQCDTVGTGQGGGGGQVPGLDGVVAGLSQDFGQPAPDSSADPVGRWLLSVSAGIPIDVSTTISSCIGTSTEISQYQLQLPDCPGTEIIDSDPARIFDFDCTFSQGGYDWRVVGKVKLSG